MHKLSHRHTENPTHPQERPTRKKSHQTVNERDRTGPGHQKHITILRALVDLLTFGLSERLLTVTTAQKRARGSLSPSSTALSIVDPRVIVVGLGNPGTLYKNTRHNAGQLLLQKLFPPGDESAYGNLDGARVLEGELGAGFPALAVLPASFMNLSGRCVEKLCRRFNIKESQILVLHDDIDLPVGKIKMKTGGSTGGHRGLDSIAQHLRSPGFCRLRIGVGRPADKADVPDYVLQTFTDKEMETLVPVFERLVDLASTIPAAMDSEGARSTLLNALTTRAAPISKKPSRPAAASAATPAASTEAPPTTGRGQSFGATSLAVALNDDLSSATKRMASKTGDEQNKHADGMTQRLHVAGAASTSGAGQERAPLEEQDEGTEPPSTRQRSE